MPKPTTLSGPRILGAALLFTSAGIHLDLYLTGYQRIPTIGWLFLLQFASGVALGLSTLISSHRLVAISAAAFAFGTIVGYTLSRFAGLFGFHEHPTTAGLVAGLLEFGAVAAFGFLALSPSVQGEQAGVARIGRASSIEQRLWAPGLALGAAAALALVLVSGVGSGSAPTTTKTAAAAVSGSVVHVVIVNFAFQPSNVKVSPGEEVVVKNEDSVDHTLTAQPGATPSANFNTGDIAPGATKDFTAPTKAGTYAFYCSIHNFMTGELTVS